jgi:phosphoribosylglycinamide formyltransferase-1
MKILSPEFVAGHKDRIVNIHPSLLPAFPGAKGIEDAWNYGVKITGVTIHLVDEKMDNGPVLAQEAVKVETKDTLEKLAEKIHKTEHDLYWKTLSSLFKGKLIYTNRRNS